MLRYYIHTDITGYVFYKTLLDAKVDFLTLRTNEPTALGIENTLEDGKVELSDIYIRSDNSHFPALDKNISHELRLAILKARYC